MVSINTEPQPLPEGVTFRLAVIDDLNALVDICRQCFPDYYRWQSIYPSAKNWWSEVLKSKSCITIVLEDISGIFGLNVLVVDLNLWSEEKRMRNGSFINRAISVLLCPYPAVWKRLWKKAIVRVSYRKPVKIKFIKKHPERTAWLELSAVLPRRQNRGFGALIAREINRRALSADIEYIQSHIESDNIVNRRLREKIGYKLISEDSRGCIYEKSLV